MKCILSFILLFKMSLAMTQSTYQITGSVVNEEGQGLDLSSVLLLDQSDSTLVKSEFTDEDGSFLFTNIKETLLSKSLLLTAN